MSCEMPFNVNIVTDLNDYPNTLKPSQAMDSKSFISCCCFDNGTFNVKMELDRTGFVCGDKCHIKIDVENLTGMSCKVVTKLIQTVTCTKVHKVVSVNKIYEKELSKVDGGQTAPIMHTVTIPCCVPSGMKAYQFMDWQYELKVEVTDIYLDRHIISILYEFFSHI